MPIVHVEMKQRDDVRKTLLAKRICDAIAEITVNSLDGIHVIFSEVPLDSWSRGGVLLSERQGGARPVDRPGYVTMTRVRYDPAREQDYLDWRRDRLNPILAKQKGFVGWELVRLEDAPGEYFLALRWESEADAKAWRTAEVHQVLRAEAKDLLPEPLESVGSGELVHLYTERD